MTQSDRLPRLPTHRFEEWDVVERWRHHYKWTKRPRRTAKVKRQIRRRERRSWNRRVE